MSDSLQAHKLLSLARPYLEKNEFGVNHTQRVLEIAEKRLGIPRELEELTTATIILHDIGGSTVKEQYEKGPGIATALLEQLGYPDEFITNVCKIVATHHDRPENPSEAFKILFDADQLVRLSREEFPVYESEGTNWNLIINRMYFEKSKPIARRLLEERQTEKTQA
jgi:predicted metal-dependent HD superfamily phosphohydrolase